MTLERTGRSMKNFEIMASPIWPMRAAARFSAACGSTFWPGIARNSPAIDDTVVGLEAAFDHAQIVLDRPGLDLALLDDVVAVHDQHVASGLVAAQRHVRHQQRVLLLIEGNADTDEIAGQQHAVGVRQHAAHRQRSRRLVDRRRRIIELALVRIAVFGLQPDLDRKLLEIARRQSPRAASARMRNTSCSLTLKFT